MESMEITRLDASNFTENSLDDFSRYQEVTQVYRLIDGRLQHVPLTFTEDWPLARRREKAREILRRTHIVYGAVENGEVVGVIMLLPALDYGRMVRIIAETASVGRCSRRQRRKPSGAVQRRCTHPPVPRGKPLISTAQWVLSSAQTQFRSAWRTSRAMCSWNAPFEQRIKRVCLPSAECTRFLLRENATLPEIC